MSSLDTNNENLASPRHRLKITIPTKPEELDILPEYNGPDAIHIYSSEDQLVFWTDPAGDHWWLVQRPNGSFAKLSMDQ